MTLDNQTSMIVSDLKGGADIKPGQINAKKNRVNRWKNINNNKLLALQ